VSRRLGPWPRWTTSHECGPSAGESRSRVGSGLSTGPPISAPSPFYATVTFAPGCGWRERERERERESVILAEWLFSKFSV